MSQKKIEIGNPNSNFSLKMYVFCYFIMLLLA